MVNAEQRKINHRPASAAGEKPGVKVNKTAAPYKTTPFHSKKAALHITGARPCWLGEDCACQCKQHETPNDADYRVKQADHL
jgi:hypothetical protein